MLFILIAAVFSVLVSVLLKLYKARQFNILQILCLNYISASLLSWLWFQPHFSHFDFAHAWWLILIMGMLLPSIFWCLDHALQHSGLIKTEIAQRLSVACTILVSSLIYQEQFSGFKIAGLVFGMIAILLLLNIKRQTHPNVTHIQHLEGLQTSASKLSKFKNLPLSLLAVWIGYATVDLLFKYTASLGLKFASTLTAIFLVSALLMLAVNVFKKTKWTWSSIAAGLFLGVLNFANIAFYLSAHQQLKDSPALVFAAMNILVMILGVFAALVIFKENLTKNKIFGVILALICVYCLMQSLN